MIELPRADRCCGFGGTFSVKNPEISEVMTREKALEIAGTGANVISGSDQACLMNIAGMLDRSSQRRRNRSPYQSNDILLKS